MLCKQNQLPVPEILQNKCPRFLYTARSVDSIVERVTRFSVLPKLQDKGFEYNSPLTKLTNDLLWQARFFTDFTSGSKHVSI